MMEALTSEQALADIMNEGSESFYRSLPKSSLPQRNRKHIFDGLDTSFIDRDILKIPCRTSSISPSMLSQNGKISQLSESANCKPPAGSPVFRKSLKYKHFLRQKSAERDTFRALPVLQHRSQDIPVNYNTFISSFVEEGMLKSDMEMCASRDGRKKEVVVEEEKVLRCSDNLKQVEEMMTYPSFEKLRLHIGDVNRMMGREQTIKLPPKTVPSTRSRGRSEDNGPQFSLTSSRSVKYSRYSHAGGKLRSELSCSNLRAKYSRSTLSATTTNTSIRFNVYKKPEVPAINIQPPR